MHWRRLSLTQIEKIVELLKPYWIRGFRNDLELGLVGYLYKLHYAKEDVKKLILRICEETKDEEVKHRLYLVEFHYNPERAKRKRYTGLSHIAWVIKRITKNERETQQVIKQLRLILEAPCVTRNRIVTKPSRNIPKM